MDSRRLLVVGVAVAVIASGIGLPIVGIAMAQETTTQDATETADDGTAPMGTQLTAFMQHSAAQANDTVEDGMWLAAFEEANESEQARRATARADDLEVRLESLRAEREDLRAQRDDGTFSRAEFTARASELNGRIDALESAINGTERAAERAGVNVSALEVLQHNASELTGPEVAGIARGLAGTAGGPPTNASRPDDVGPPTDAGPPDAGPPTAVGPPDDDVNGTDGPPGGGPPEENPGGNDAGGGDDGDDSGQGNGPPDDDPGQGNGPPDDDPG